MTRKFFGKVFLLQNKWNYMTFWTVANRFSPFIFLKSLTFGVYALNSAEKSPIVAHASSLPPDWLSLTQTPPIPFHPLPLIGSSPPLQDNQKVHIYSEPGGTIVCIQRHLRQKNTKNRLLLILIWDYYCFTVVNLL